MTVWRRVSSWLVHKVPTDGQNQRAAECQDCGIQSSGTGQRDFGECCFTGLTCQQCESVWDLQDGPQDSGERNCPEERFDERLAMCCLSGRAVFESEEFVVEFVRVAAAFDGIERVAQAAGEQGFARFADFVLQVCEELRHIGHVLPAVGNRRQERFRDCLQLIADREPAPS